MPYRPKDIYRGRRKFRVPLTILLFVLAGLLIGAVALFYALQQYLVYDQSGVTLQLPYMRTEPPAEETEEAPPTPAFEPVEVQVIYDEPDFSDLDLGGWQGLGSVRLRFVPFADASSQTRLAAAISAAQDGDFNGVLLELKPRSGQLAWASENELAAAYGTAGSMDYAETVAALHEQGLLAVAQISCCADELMGTRNWPVTLQQVSGTPYKDSGGVYWLDPYNRSIRAYLTGLARELAAMGFDEIVLADLYHPVGEGSFLYSVSLPTEPNPVTAVCQMGRRIAEALAESETAVSVRIDADSLRNGLSAQTGQELSIFWRLFARVYCPTDYWTASSDLELAAETMNAGTADVRFVPVSELIPEGMGSYVVR